MIETTYQYHTKVITKYPLTCEIEECENDDINQCIRCLLLRILEKTEANPEEQAPEQAPVKTCIDCGNDISGRGPAAKRCKDCASNKVYYQPSKAKRLKKAKGPSFTKVAGIEDPPKGKPSGTHGTRLPYIPEEEIPKAYRGNYTACFKLEDDVACVTHNRYVSYRKDCASCKLRSTRASWKNSHGRLLEAMFCSKV